MKRLREPISISDDFQSDDSSNHELDISDLAGPVHRLYTVKRGWTIRGSWTSKLHGTVGGRIEICQNAENFNDYELRLTYRDGSSYATGETRQWSLEGRCLNESHLQLRSKNFGNGQYITVDLRRDENFAWIGSLTSIEPADIAGIVCAVV